MNFEIDSFPDREVIINGEKFLYFGGTAYLGLQTDSLFQKILIKNIKKYGTNYGASRNANIQITVYKKAEDYLAKLIKSEDCLTLSSGFLSGQMVAKYFHSKNRNCFYAPGTHEALHVLGTKSYKNCKRLISDLKKELKNKNANPVLFLDSISLDGRNYPCFEWLKNIALEGITLVVDDSHGFGIIGENGSGVYEYIKKLNPKELVICGSLGKGFGIQAGLIASSTKTIKKLRKSSMYAAASPASSAALATLIESDAIILKKRKQLIENITYFKTNLNVLSSFKQLPDYPSFSFNDIQLASYLLKEKVVITNFNYPTKKDNQVLRIVVSSNHQKEDLNKLTHILNNYFSK